MRNRVRVSTSPIHGKGLFAATSIKAGEVVGRYRSRKTKLEGDEHPHVLIIYDPDTGEELERRIGTNDFRFVNHSATPNLELDIETLQFTALRDVAQDEELTWHYGEEFEDEVG